MGVSRGNGKHFFSPISPIICNQLVFTIITKPWVKLQFWVEHLENGFALPYPQMKKLSQVTHAISHYLLISGLKAALNV